MPTKRILFVSWEGGMGHITRDVAIAAQLHKRRPDVELSWLASPLATRLLEEVGENLLPESRLGADYNTVGQKALGEFSVDILKLVLLCGKAWAHNIRLFRDVVNKYEFDLVIGDESYEVVMALDSGKMRLKCPFVMIHDLIGVIPMTWNPLDRLFAYAQNWKWARFQGARCNVTNFFVGELEDIPDDRFGFLLCNKRDWARGNCEFLGYIIRFDPTECSDRAQIRAELGYGKQPLVVCALGGSSAGKELLTLCGRAYPMLKHRIPNLHMMAVCGGQLSPESLNLPEGIDVRGYVPDLYKHFAASDLTIVVGGGTSTTELTALGRPFLYFPLEQQFEQQILIPERLARHNAGLRMTYRETTPDVLAERVIANMGAETHYAPIPVDGAQKAVELIGRFLS